MSASRAAVASGKEVKGKETGSLLSEVESQVSREHSIARGQGDDAMDSTALGLDNVEGNMGETDTDTDTDTDTAPGARDVVTQ